MPGMVEPAECEPMPLEWASPEWVASDECCAWPEPAYFSFAPS